MSRTTIGDWSKAYRDEPDFHDQTIREFIEGTNSIPDMKKQRDFIEQSFKEGVNYGHGHRSLQYLWKLIVDEMPQEFSFLEIGVYKGQIISAVKTLAKIAGKKANIVGVTPLSDPDFANYNRMPYIENMFKICGCDMEGVKIIDGFSQNKQIVDQVKSLGFFDIVYVDGDHSYTSTVFDIETYGCVLKEGGLLVVDDCNSYKNHSPGVFRGIEDVSNAVRDSIENKPNVYEEIFTIMHVRVWKKIGKENSVEGGKNDKTKIAFIKFGGLAAGGTEKNFQSIAANLPRDEFEVDYFYCDSAPYIGSDYIHSDTDVSRKDYMESKNVNLIKFAVQAKDVRYPHHPWVNTDFWSLFDKQKYDLVALTRSGHPEYPATEIHDVPIVEIITLPGMAERKKNIVKSIHISRFQAESWVRAGGDPSIAEIIPIIDDLTIDVESSKSFREEFGIDPEAVVYGFHQRNDPNIFSPAPLLAFKELQKNTDKKIAFVMLGGSHLHREEAQQLQIEDCYFIDHTGDPVVISRFLSTLDVFTHGRSDGETGGLVFVEAMRHGLPCISHFAAANGHVETIGDAGIVHGNFDCYIFEMLNLLENKDYREWRSERAKTRYNQFYSVEKTIQRYSNIFKDVAYKRKKNQYSFDLFSGENEYLNKWLNG